MADKPEEPKSRAARKIGMSLADVVRLAASKPTMGGKVISNRQRGGRARGNDRQGSLFDKRKE